MEPTMVPDFSTPVYCKVFETNEVNYLATIKAIVLLGIKYYTLEIHGWI